MKKIYFFAIVAFLGSLTVNAQFATDDIEAYPLGPIFTPRWTTWDGTNDGVQNAIVSDQEARSGVQSILIGPSGGGQDAILDFQEAAPSGSGIWTSLWYMYIPSGNTGYWNIQGNTTPSANDNLQFLSGNITMVAGTLSDDNSGFTGTYPEDTWFAVRTECDTTAETYEIFLDGTSIGSASYNAPSDFFAGIDLFADVTTNTYYIDDAQLVQGTLGTDDFSADIFSVYPNPVNDILNINSKVSVDAVTVYDILGKVVVNTQPGVISPSIDMSALSSGAYLVKVTIGDASKTVKVIK